MIVVAGEALVDLVPDRSDSASLIADRDLYLDRFWRALRRTDVLKLSVEDLRWLTSDLPPRTAARELGDVGPAVVIVTDGPHGAIVVGRSETEDLLVTAPTVDVVDTIGAGDAFNAGFLAHWRQYGGRLDDRDAVSAATQFACLVATLACAHPGAEPRDVPDLG
jgi:fructokinase